MSSIESISSQIISRLNYLTSQKSSSSTSTSSTDTDNTTDDTFDIQVSGPAEFLSKLQQLKDQDPAKFKEIMTEAADSIRELAKQSTNTNAIDMLTNLADNFDKVAAGGDLSLLEPPKPSDSQLQQYVQNAQNDLQMIQSMLSSNPSSETDGASKLDDIFKNLMTEVSKALA